MIKVRSQLDAQSHAALGNHQALRLRRMLGGLLMMSLPSLILSVALSSSSSYRGSKGVSCFPLSAVTLAALQ